MIDTNKIKVYKRKRNEKIDVTHITYNAYSIPKKNKIIITKTKIKILIYIYILDTKRLDLYVIDSSRNHIIDWSNFEYTRRRAFLVHRREARVASAPHSSPFVDSNSPV